MHAQPSICIVVNVKSGRGSRHDPVAAITTALKNAGLEADIRVTRKGNQISGVAEKARDDGFDIVVAAGGDGTISAVAACLLGSGQVMGVIPMGTFNYFARSLGISQDVEAAVELLATGTARTIPAATFNGNLFLNNASLGAYPAILRNRETIYARWGRSRAAAYWSVLTTLAGLRRPLDLTVRANGAERQFRTPLVFAINNAYQLEQIGLEGASHIAEGKMALFVSARQGRWQMLKGALALALGTARKHDDYELIAADRIEIDSPRKSLGVARDGERARVHLPLRLEVHQDALRVIAPAAAADVLR